MNFHRACNLRGGGAVPSATPPSRMPSFSDPQPATGAVAVLAIALLAGGAQPVLAQADGEPTVEEAVAPRPVYVTRRIDGAPPSIDGALDDSTWAQVPWSGSGFYQRQPDDTAPVTEDTRFKIIYDDRFLYVAWRAFDSDPELIEARLGRRDEFPGDWVEINFDSFHDRRTAFSFTTSASGVRGDEFVSNDGDNWDSSWNPYWVSRARRDSLGYTVEAKIPFSQLRFGKTPEQEWGLQVNRNLFRRQESSSWAQVRQTQPGWVSRFGTLRGLEGIRPRKPLELQPYVLGQLNTGGDPAPDDPYAEDVEGRLAVGLDGRIGLTNDIAVDFTVNPDFGQVEADPGAINLDGFQIFFREQRPFFVENRNIFDYGLTEAEAGGSFNSDILFYSRRIGGSPSRRINGDASVSRFVDQPDNTTILGAAKVSGKTAEGLSVGLLSSVTERERATVLEGGEERREIVEPLTAYNVGRLQQDFNDRQSTIGVMLTSVNRDLSGDPELEFLREEAYSAGVDLVHRWDDRAWYVRANAVASRVAGSTEAITRTQTDFERLYQRPDADHLGVDSTATSLTGTGGELALGNSEGDWVFEAGGTFRTPGLELNDIGFLQEADRMDFYAWGARRWRNPVGPFNRFQWNHNLYAGADWSGASTYRRYNTNAWGQLKTFNNFNAYLTLEEQDISKTILRGGPRFRRPTGFFTGGSFSTDNRKDFVAWVYGGFGGAYDRDIHRRYNVGADVNWQPLDALRIYFGPNFERVRRRDQYFATVDDAGGEPAYLHGSIDQQTLSLTLRLTYNLTPDFTVQYYGQPFVARGVYDEFKRVTDAPLAKDFDERLETFAAARVRREGGGSDYTVVDGDGQRLLGFGDPDFNFLQFRSNMVLRWEYLPSSTLFLVWSQGVTGGADPETQVLEALRDDLFGEGVRNTFLLKATYRWVR